MMVNVYGAKCSGIEAIKVTVEIDIRNGIGIHLVGLADTAVKESILRTVNALQSLGYHIPGRKIVINLAPADLRKNGSGYDLPIAVGILAASEQVFLPNLGKCLIMGELGLDGSIRPIEGSLSFVEMARDCGFKACVLPLTSALEAVDLTEIPVYGVRSFEEALRAIAGSDCDDLLIWNTDEFRQAQDDTQDSQAPEIDFCDIIGQETAKRGIEIAAAGNHNVIMIGPPGTGKSSLAKAMAGILPPMTKEEALVTTKIYSVAGKGNLRHGLIHKRPVRTPHYSASLAAIIGGGNGDNILPGEISLAQNGILFCDEFAQMPKSVLESLRGPLEDRKVTISRLRSKIEYPASFMLVAASNPCPCGYWGEEGRCTCTPTQRLNYLTRLSGPIMDRIDIQLIVRNVNVKNIRSSAKSESSSSVAERVEKARSIQKERFREETIFTNAEMSNKMIEKYCPLGNDASDLLTQLTEKFSISMRGYFRIIKVARTIADLEGSDNIEANHILEAVGFRFLDKRIEL